MKRRNRKEEELLSSHALSLSRSNFSFSFALLLSSSSEQRVLTRSYSIALAHPRRTGHRLVLFFSRRTLVPYTLDVREFPCSHVLQSSHVLHSHSLHSHFFGSHIVTDFFLRSSLSLPFFSSFFLCCCLSSSFSPC